ncbi:MAG: hypothetical protein QNJ91_13030 [Gammaproteobacteria bacterium]|nr:hypothetical protein [Gammaproteobacteria bacterium]
MAGIDYRWGAFARKDAVEVRAELLDTPASQLVVRVLANADGSLPTVAPGLVASLIERGLADGWVPDAGKPGEWPLDDVAELSREHDLAFRKSLLCLVITPFDAGASRLRDAVARSVRELGLQVRDAADAAASPSAAASIADWVAEADIVVADVTRRNPNTFYEVGFAHALGKPTILLIDEGSAESVPAALSGNLFLTYTPDDLRALHDSLKRAVMRVVRVRAAG